MKSIRFLLIPLFSLLVACGSVPVKSLVQARAELDLAKSEEAPVYAADSYNSALGNLKAAHKYVVGGRHFRAAGSAENARWLAFQAREETAFSKAALLRKKLEDLLNGIRLLLGRSYSRDTRFNRSLNFYNRGVSLHSGADKESVGLKHKKRREKQLVKRRRIVRLYQRAVTSYEKAFPPAQSYLGALLKDKQKLLSGRLVTLYGKYRSSERMKDRFLDLRKSIAESRLFLDDKKYEQSVSRLDLAVQGRDILEKDLQKADARLDLNRAMHLYVLYKLKFSNMAFGGAGKKAIDAELKRKAAIDIALHNARVFFRRAEYDSATKQAQRVVRLVQQAGLADRSALPRGKKKDVAIKRDVGHLKKTITEKPVKKQPLTKKALAARKAAKRRRRAFYKKIQAWKKAGTWKTYIVRKLKDHDTLWKVSETFYGTRRKWQKIFNANRDVLSDPHVIHPGQILKIPPP